MDIAALFDQEDVIFIAGRSFCFTGSFAFDSRVLCRQQLGEYGGVYHPRVIKDTDYLVVGKFAVSSWANTGYGRKLEKAVCLQKAKHEISIISENQLLHAMYQLDRDRFVREWQPDLFAAVP